ncbi:camphor resistance protein CrcB [Prevotella sp. P3-120]|uniref:fluoride efflux transporter CrcB n=1 Tax=unclassified Prevotella TaxID=2638335 RepID=UPI000B9681A0|nr:MULTISPECIES: fluoride efflux transporter CrcB [unclassified Prevotella]OYP41864.1 camphor resistance protein CrcB [Prevotella sp. P4-119]OYP50089.1 camphor resistance protein CrcB [Prevotella sp. P3-120]OYP52011.1 camphor resistance protein CrcB [Prevotella sp. P3-92]
MKQLLLVCVGSFFGGGLRYLVSKFTSQWLAFTFPMGTFIVNVLGCFLIGILSGCAIGGHLSPNAKLLLVTGFCGGFTTFSTFMNENLLLARDGQQSLTLLYMVLSLICGLIAVIVGYWLASKL